MDEKSETCIESAERPKKTQFTLEWNGEMKVLGDAYDMRQMLECLAKLGYKEFKISVK